VPVSPRPGADYASYRLESALARLALIHCGTLLDRFASGVFRFAAKSM
jgi:hypothetical protein